MRRIIWSGDNGMAEPLTPEHFLPHVDKTFRVMTSLTFITLLPHSRNVWFTDLAKAGEAS